MLNRQRETQNQFVLHIATKLFFLSAPRPTLTHGREENLTHPILITAIVKFRAEGHREPRNKFGSLSQVEGPVEFKAGIFRFLSQRLNPLGHELELPQRIIAEKRTNNIIFEIRMREFEQPANTNDNT